MTAKWLCAHHRSTAYIRGQAENEVFPCVASYQTHERIMSSRAIRQRTLEETACICGCQIQRGVRTVIRKRVRVDVRTGAATYRSTGSGAEFHESNSGRFMDLGILDTVQGILRASPRTTLSTTSTVSRTR